MPDREAERVELAEHPGERGGGLLVDDELSRVGAPVEAPVPDCQDAQPCEGDGAAGVPDGAAQLSLERGRQRLDRRRERERDEWRGEQAQQDDSLRGRPGEGYRGEAAASPLGVTLRGAPQGPAHVLQRLLPAEAAIPARIVRAV